MTFRRHVFIGAAGLVLTCGIVLAAVAQTPDTIVAAQVRDQGHACSEPSTVERDAAQSRPDSAVWLLRCADAAYRVRLVPDMAARIEKLR